MYPISDEVMSLFNRNYRQIVSITGKNGTKTFELTESNIAQGGLSINRYCVSGSKIEIGSAIASELTLKLDNRDDRYEDTQFEGEEVEVKIGIKKWDAYRWENAKLHWIPCGFFTVDETPRKLAYITLTALDRMVRFDKEVNADDLTFPTTIATLLTVCCNNCGVPLKTNPTSLTNSNYIVQNFPETDGLTYRQIIQWIAEITATCAFIDWDGKLCFKWYSDNDFSISPSERYSSDMYEQDISISGVQISDDDDNVYLAGTDDYAFNIENNGLIQGDQETVAAAIYEKVKGFTYRPYNCTCKPMPYVYPLDGVIYTDKKGVKHKSIVTNITFKMNAATSLEGKGETNVKNGYASANPLTKGESIVLKKLEKRVSKKISNYEQANLDMNELISNSLGLYRSTITESNGSVSYYYHNGETLEQSTIIYTFKANGFAWTDKWEGNETVWQYGITKDGNAVLNILSVLKLTADQISVDTIVGAINEDGSKLSISADHIDLQGKTLTATLSDYVTDDGLKNTLKQYVTEKSLTTTLTSYAKSSDLDDYAKTSELTQFITSSELRTTLTSYAKTDDLEDYAKTSELSQYITSSELTTTLTSYAKSSDGNAQTFAYTLKSDGLTCKANNEEVLKVNASGLYVKGVVMASSGNIGKLILTQTDGYYSSITRSDDVTKNISVTIPSGTIGINDGVSVFNWYAAVSEISLADLGITDANAVLGEFTVQTVNETTVKAGLAGCDKSHISVYAMVRGKGATLTFDMNVTVTITYCTYSATKTATTVSKLCSPDNTFDISSALSTSIFTVNNIRSNVASINELNAPTAVIGGIKINKECISANGINITFDTRSSTTVGAEILIKGTTLFVYCDTVIYFDKVLPIKYSNSDANFDKTINVTIKGGTSFSKVEVPTFNEITTAVFVDSGKSTTTFSAETPDDAAQYAYEERALIFDNPQLLTTGYYNSTYHVRMGGSLGSADQYWTYLYAYEVRGINIYQNGTAITTSDKNAKNSISYFDDSDSNIYSSLFDKLRPAAFKYNDGESGRTHWGFIAQDIEQELEEVGLSDNKSAVFCKWKTHKKGENNEVCGIRYEELIPILTYEIQKLKKQIKILSKEAIDEE